MRFKQVNLGDLARIAMLVCALLQACATVTGIPGVVMTPGQTASLIMLANHALVAFDGVRLVEPLYAGMSGREFIIPIGQHSIELSTDWGNNWKDALGRPLPGTTFVVLEFEAKSGHSYRIQRDVSRDAAFLAVSVEPYIVDLETGRIVSNRHD